MPKHKVLFSVTLLAIAIMAIGGYFLYSFAKELQATQVLLAKTVSSDNNKIQDLENKLVEKQTQNESLASALQTERNINNGFASQIQGIVGTVGSLQKLTATDKQLLQKYSKIYFLNENYIPNGLTTIDAHYAFAPLNIPEILTGVWPHLSQLLHDAETASTPLQIISAYRSFGTQSTLKSSYTFTYGSGANQFSADQGYSEHQLGTAIDFTTPTLGTKFSDTGKFEGSASYTWLLANSYRYGFILSYPKGNGYYQFEPWHWRYVGVALATRLHDEGKHFYDLAQRDIDQYLISFFD